MLLAGPGGVDIAGVVNGERGDFFLGSAVEDERLASWRDAIDQAAAIGAGNQIPLGIEGEDANVHFVAFEEQRVFAVGADLVDFAMIARGYVKIAGVVEGEIPDVFGAGVEVDGGAPGIIRRRIA